MLACVGPRHHPAGEATEFTPKRPPVFSERPLEEVSSCLTASHAHDDVQELCGTVANMQQDIRGLMEAVERVLLDVHQDREKNKEEKQMAIQYGAAQQHMENTLHESISKLQQQTVQLSEERLSLVAIESKLSEESQSLCALREASIMEREAACKSDRQTERRWCKHHVGDLRADNCNFQQLCGDDDEDISLRGASDPLTRRSLTSTSLETGGDMPMSAFVLNFRRLLTMQRFFSLLHELIKSTAIAALTLVAAGSGRQIGFTSIFIVFVFMLYVRHERVFDALDIDDVKSLLPLMRDDDDACKDQNPNRLLKSISIHSHWLLRWSGYGVLVTLGGASIMGWLSLRSWNNYLAESSGDTIDRSWVDALSQELIGDEDDATTLAMQLIILDLMSALELVFEYMLWREMASVFPPTPDGAVWDPRVHGVPRHWLLGLPSMWFTSKGALDRLKQYIISAQIGGDVRFAGQLDICVQELACYALLGDDERMELSRALKDAKLVDAKKQPVAMAPSKPQATEPGTLGITLCFFDDKGRHFKDRRCCEHPGQLQYFSC